MSPLRFASETSDVKEAHAKSYAKRRVSGRTSKEYVGAKEGYAEVRAGWKQIRERMGDEKVVKCVNDEKWAEEMQVRDFVNV